MGQDIDTSELKHCLFFTSNIIKVWDFCFLSVTRLTARSRVTPRAARASISFIIGAEEYIRPGDGCGIGFSLQQSYMTSQRRRESTSRNLFTTRTHVFINNLTLGCRTSGAFFAKTTLGSLYRFRARPPQIRSSCC